LRIDSKSNILITWDWATVSVNSLTQIGKLVGQYKNLL
jgi:hypothetical protein